MKTCSVKIRGCGGIELFYCRGEATAKRIRKAVRLYKSEGHFAGSYTLARLVSLASDRAGYSAKAIVREFVLGGLLDMTETLENEKAESWKIN